MGTRPADGYGRIRRGEISKVRDMTNTQFEKLVAALLQLNDTLMRIEARQPCTRCGGVHEPGICDPGIEGPTGPTGPTGAPDPLARNAMAYDTAESAAACPPMPAALADAIADGRVGSVSVQRRARKRRGSKR